MVAEVHARLAAGSHAGETVVTDSRKVLDAVGARAGWRAGEIRSKMFRHPYCSTRLQSLDGGAPVSAYLVGRELGHGGDSLVKRRTVRRGSSGRLRRGIYFSGASLSKSAHARCRGEGRSDPLKWALCDHSCDHGPLELSKSFAPVAQLDRATAF